MNTTTNMLQRLQKAEEEAAALGIDTNALFTSGNYITLKHRYDRIEAVVKDRKEKISAEFNNSKKTETKEAKPSGKVEVVSNTAEERSKRLSDAKKTLNTERR